MDKVPGYYSLNAFPDEFDWIQVRRILRNLSGEMMTALHPYNLQKYAFIAVVAIAVANAVFGVLYM